MTANSLRSTPQGHTPGPWKPIHAEYHPFGTLIQAFYEDESMQVKELTAVGYIYDPADAAFVVRACNAHDDLLAALELCLFALVDDPNGPDRLMTPAERKAADTARTAIRKACPELAEGARGETA